MTRAALTLQEIATQAGALKPGDRDPLVEIGVALEASLDELPEGSPLRPLLEDCLEGLQGLYLDTLADPARSLAAMVAAVNAAAQAALSQLHLTAAGDALRQVLTGPPRVPCYPPVPFSASLPTKEDLLDEFLVDSYEALDRVDRALLALEQNPSDSAPLSGILRALHSIKGNCGFFGLSQVRALAHAGETLLERLRDEEIDLCPPVTGALLAMVDALREILASVERRHGEGDRDDQALIAALNGFQKAEAAGAEAADEPPLTFGQLLVQRGLVKPEALAKALQQQAAGDPRRLGEILVEQGALQPRHVVETLHMQEEARVEGVVDHHVRVDIGRLDRLKQQMDALDAARGKLFEVVSGYPAAALRHCCQRLDRIIREVKAEVIQLRLQPISTIWSKLPRVVRDVAVTGRKEIALEMEGSETELDKAVLAAIKDPLIHLARNCADHGIECPEVRVARGKPPEGRLLLRAFRSGEHAHIQISDDGSGIDAERIRERAVERGFLPAGQAALMDDRELMELIFLPGFSTADTVTAISGRGVGMDVVKCQIQEIGGRILVDSQPGQGTMFHLIVPLTME